MADRAQPRRRAGARPSRPRVRGLPRLAQALARGELSYAKVHALMRVATPETEERLLKVGKAGTAEHVERIVRAWRYVDRKAEVQDNGWLLPAVPAPVPAPAAPVDDLRAQNDALGLQINARTSMPSWLGERLDLGYAIDVLHPLAGVRRGR